MNDGPATDKLISCSLEYCLAGHPWQEREITVTPAFWAQFCQEQGIKNDGRGGKAFEFSVKVDALQVPDIVMNPTLWP